MTRVAIQEKNSSAENSVLGYVTVCRLDFSFLRAAWKVKRRSSPGWGVQSWDSLVLLLAVALVCPWLSGRGSVENSRYAQAGSTVKKPKPLAQSCEVSQRVWTAGQVCEDKCKRYLFFCCFSRGKKVGWTTPDGSFICMLWSLLGCTGQCCEILRLEMPGRQ